MLEKDYTICKTSRKKKKSVRHNLRYGKNFAFGIPKNFEINQNINFCSKHKKITNFSNNNI